MLYDTFAALDRELSGRGSPLSGMSMPVWRAPLDVRRESDRFVADLDLPGVDPSSIDVTFEDGWLAKSAPSAPTPVRPRTRSGSSTSAATRPSYAASASVRR